MNRRRFLQGLAGAVLAGAIKAAPLAALAQRSLAAVYEPCQVFLTRQWIPDVPGIGPVWLVHGQGEIAGVDYYAAEYVAGGTPQRPPPWENDQHAEECVMEAFRRRERQIYGG